MRIAAYAGASSVLAAAVVLRAFHERPNFYSATVYMGQSNACRMILLNFLLLSAGSTMFVLQRLLYGRLRPIEIEQLWDKGWYAVTETALAMTTFRDEVGGWFFILFMALLAGKVWGWIGEGRVEILEQQPPANPRLFHARLSTSLLLSLLFDGLMLRYCIRTLQEQPRPGMMVMFGFEFAVLVICASSTIARYCLSLRETLVIKQQTKARIEERKEEIRVAREEATRSADGAAASANLPSAEDVDEADIDVPGWQEKGRWVLFLDLITDFLKLVLYAGFFLILLIFSGIPIHMFRDLFVTLRSFLKRINDFVRYRNATRDMNVRYPDATAEELERDGTCIICREEMRLWQSSDAQAQSTRPSRSPPDERQRPKKLPCGHILHVGCLRSWLERQQVCPTCRASVLAPPRSRNTGSGQAPPHRPDNQPYVAPRGNGAEQQLPPQPPPQPPNQHDAANGDQGNQPREQPGGVRARTFGLGNFRLTLAAGNGPAVRQALEQHRHHDRTNHGDRSRSQTRPLDENSGPLFARSAAVDYQSQLASLERRIVEEIRALNATQQQLAAVRALQGQLTQLRALQENPGPATDSLGTGRGVQATPVFNDGSAGASRPSAAVHMPLHFGQQYGPQQTQLFTAPLQQPRFTSDQAGFPEGLSLPDGWSLQPLQRHVHQMQGRDEPVLNSNDVVTQTATPLADTDYSSSVEAPHPSPQRSSTLYGAGEGEQSDSQEVAPETNSTDDGAQAPQVEIASSGRVHDGQTSSIPDWSSLGTGSAPKEDVAARKDQGEGSTFAANGPAENEKGKAKAAQVEDVNEDDDE